MGLKLFPDPVRGLSEFRGVLREGGWASVSVNTVPQRAFTTRADAISAGMRRSAQQRVRVTSLSAMHVHRRQPRH
jgi:hypothetical protein